MGTGKRARKFNARRVPRRRTHQKVRRVWRGRGMHAALSTHPIDVYNSTSLQSMKAVSGPEAPASE
jgi:hypothetical protein